MSNEYICKEALGTLFGIGPYALKTLVSHAKKHTLLIHGLTGRVNSFSLSFKRMSYLHLHTSLRTKSFLQQTQGLRGIHVMQLLVLQLREMRKIIYQNQIQDVRREVSTKNMLIYIVGKFKQQPRETSLKRLIILKQMRNINSKQKFVVGNHFGTTGKKITPI